MKALNRCKKPDWFDHKIMSFLLTVFVYFVIGSFTFLSYVIYKMFSPIDLETAITTGFALFVFCATWYFIDDAIPK